jgi:hypothetical protein
MEGMWMEEIVAQLHVPQQLLEETEKNHVKYYKNNHSWSPGLDLIT